MMVRGAVWALVIAMGLLCPAAAEDGPGGVWVGSYLCWQGVTALRLKISPRVDGHLDAVFGFGPVPSNPGVPVGSYAMSGEYDPATGRVVLEPGRWKVRPPGYVTVGLDGVVDCAGTRIEGRITGTGSEGCGWFSVVREGAEKVECERPSKLMSAR